MSYNDPELRSFVKTLLKRSHDERVAKKTMTREQRSSLLPKYPKSLEQNVVYMVTCEANGKRYVGSTEVPFSHRMSNLFSAMKHGRCHVKEMQRDYVKYGAGSFSSVIIERSNPLYLRTTEKVLIEGLRPEYNVKHAVGRRIS